MILLIDAGNSQVKLRGWDGHKLHALQSLGEDDHALAAFAGGQALISCVATPQNRENLQQRIQKHGIQAQWLLSPTQGLGLKNAYPQANNLGVDRWLAMAAAYAACGSGCCVIDAGTAITVDICDHHGQHLGGLIAPGLQALNRALRRNTALPWIEQHDTPPPVGALANNTQQALQLGSLYSACGLIDYCHTMATQIHHSQTVYLTGGAAIHLRPYLQHDYVIDNDLVFKGLALQAQEQDTNASDSL